MHLCLPPGAFSSISASTASNQTWFPGSAWEASALEALPHEAEPRAQCVPRQSLGTRGHLQIFLRPAPNAPFGCITCCGEQRCLTGCEARSCSACSCESQDTGLAP